MGLKWEVMAAEAAGAGLAPQRSLWNRVWRDEHCAKQLAFCIIMMHIASMGTQQKSSPPGITVRFAPETRQRVDSVATAEFRSAAAYIEVLVERDLKERDEAERVVRVHVATGLSDVPSGRVTRGVEEDDEGYVLRSSVLDALFGAR